VKENDMKLKKEHSAVLLKHNLRSSDVNGYIQEFKDNETFRIYKRKDSVILFHTILSFGPADKNQVTTSMLRKIAQKFVQLRGEDCLNLAVAHLEKDHKHIHVLTSGVKVNGKSSRVSKQAFNHILNELEKYQQENYPNLTHSKNTHTKASIQGKEQLIAHLQKARKTAKLSLLIDVENAYNNAQSKEDFTQKLSSNGYEVYFRNGRPQGVISAGKKFRFTSLSFDVANLEKLREKESENSLAFTQIQAIRNKRTKNKELVKNESKHEEIGDTNKSNDELEILSKLRNKTKRYDGLEISSDSGFENRLTSFTKQIVESSSG